MGWAVMQAVSHTWLRGSYGDPKNPGSKTNTLHRAGQLQSDHIDEQISQQLSAMKAAIEEAQQAGGAESLLPPQQELSDDPIEQEGEQHDEAIAIEKRILWCSCFATAEGEWTLFFGHF